MKERKRRTECETPTPEPREVLRRLIDRKWPSSECYRLCACRKRGLIIVDRAANHQTSANGYGFQTKARLAIPREVKTAGITYATIPVDEILP